MRFWLLLIAQFHSPKHLKWAGVAATLTNCSNFHSAGIFRSAISHTNILCSGEEERGVRQLAATCWGICLPLSVSCKINTLLRHWLTVERALASHLSSSRVYIYIVWDGARGGTSSVVTGRRYSETDRCLPLSDSHPRLTMSFALWASGSVCAHHSSHKHFSTERLRVCVCVCVLRVCVQFELLFVED